MIKFFLSLLFLVPSIVFANDNITNDKKFVIIDIQDLENNHGIRQEEINHLELEKLPTLQRNIDINRIKDEILDSLRPTTNERG